MDQPVLVIGMHRSGTSALTRCLSLMGLELGPSEMLMRPQPEQPSGYWELEPLCSENDRLLALFGGSWREPPELPAGWPDQLDTFAGAMLLRSIFPSGQSWVWKDPRNCLLLPHWRRCLEILRLKPAVVFIHRHPMDVVASLRRSRGMEAHAALQLWTHHNGAALRGMAGMPVVAVSFAALLDSPEPTLRRIAAFLVRHDVRCWSAIRAASDFPRRSLVTASAPDRSIGGPLHHLLCELPAESDSFVPPLIT